jgi:hypothetical protein
VIATIRPDTHLTPIASALAAPAEEMVFRLLGLIVPLVQDAGALPEKVGSGFPQNMRSTTQTRARFRFS